MADAKRQWPECVGKTFEEAKQLVESEKPGVVIQQLAPTQPATMDYREDRVRIVVGPDGKVMVPPSIG